MMSNRLRQPVWVLAALLPLAATACDAGTAGLGFCPFTFVGEVDSTFNDPRLDALFESTGRLVVASEGLIASTLTTCNAINTDLGEATSDDVQIACETASNAITAILDQNIELTLVAEYVAPECTVDSDLVIDCTADCDVNFDVEAQPPVCTGGELSGSCSGQCSGSCTVTGDVECSGSCHGSCQGECSATVDATCTGTCSGWCEGECSVLGSDGSCAGDCTGICHGSCEGTVDGSCAGHCEGSCQGECKADIDASCEGRCTGSCDVEWVEPVCEGGYLDVEADADCEAACETDGGIEVTCTEPQVIVSFSGTADDWGKAELLAATLTDNLDSLIALGEKALIVTAAAGDMASRLDEAATAASEIGLSAIECLALAIDAQVAALARVSITIEVTVEVTASGHATST